MPAAVGFRTEPDGVDELARLTLETMQSRRFRIRKRPTEGEHQQLLAKVRYWVRRGQPVRIILGYGPMKNLNATPHNRADWAEWFALCHLCAWHNKVTTAYPPGLRITIIFDDSTVQMANRADPAHMGSYIDSVGRVIQALRYQSFLAGTMRQSSFAWLFNFGLYQVAAWRVRRWERKPEAQPVLAHMLTSARRNLLLPPELPPDEQERRYREASHRYRVYWDALQLSRFSRLGKSLIAMYLDGTQHHIRQPAVLHLATLGKEQVTQPWQGEGVLQDNGRGKLVPMVLTARRRERMEIQEVGGLQIVPLEGFDRVLVCRETTLARVTRTDQG